MGKKQPAIDRIMKNIKIEDDVDPCWIWQGGKNNVGYGLIRDDINGKKTMRSVHRVMAEHSGLDIRETNVLHTCRRHDCVNPKHLFTGTLMDVYEAREADPKNPPFGRQLGEKAPLKQCPHCARQIPNHNMAVHIRFKHKDINT